MEALCVPERSNALQNTKRLMQHQQAADMAARIGHFANQGMLPVIRPTQSSWL